MTGSATGGGWEDLRATFTQAGLPLPPMPMALAAQLERRDDWLWSTRDVDRGLLYDPRLIIDEATSPVSDYVAIAHAGHGVNSYFLTFQVVLGPLALFAQTAWGGVYMDATVQTEQLRVQFEEIAEVIDLAAAWPADARPGRRLLVLVSEYKSIDLCTWLELDGRGQPGLGRLRRSSRRSTALRRARQELDRRGPDESVEPRDGVEVTVALDWDDAGSVQLVDGALVFPADLPSQPGIYRFRFHGSDGVRVYVGETSDLRRRANHYLIGNPAGRTNKWVHDLMREHLASGGQIDMAIALDGIVTVGGLLRPLEVGRSMSRLLAEGAALHCVPPEQVLNLHGVGEG